MGNCISYLVLVDAIFRAEPSKRVLGPGVGDVCPSAVSELIKLQLGTQHSKLEDFIHAYNWLSGQGSPYASQQITKDMRGRSGLLPMLWSGFGTKTFQASWESLATAAIDHGGYIIFHGSKTFENSTPFGKLMVDAQLEKMCEWKKGMKKNSVPGHMWKALSEAFVDAWQGKTFYAAIHCPIHKFSETIMYEFELPLVKATFTGKFLIATTKKDTNEYQANCEEYVNLLREKQREGVYEKFAIECFECEDASMSDCKQSLA